MGIRPMGVGRARACTIRANPLSARWLKTVRMKLGQFGAPWFRGDYAKMFIRAISILGNVRNNVIRPHIGFPKRKRKTVSRLNGRTARVRARVSITNTFYRNKWEDCIYLSIY
eukprot:9497080-Pyramimonas_sp.AAC.1